MPEIQMPKLSDTMTEGTLVAWKKKKGDEISAGEVLAEIETDKATMEWESPEDGTLTEIYVEEGDKVAVIGGEGEEAPKEEEKAEEKKGEGPEGEKQDEKAKREKEEAKKEPEEKEEIARKEEKPEKPKTEKKEEKRAT